VEHVPFGSSSSTIIVIAVTRNNQNILCKHLCPKMTFAYNSLLVGTGITLYLKCCIRLCLFAVLRSSKIILGPKNNNAYAKKRKKIKFLQRYRKTYFQDSCAVVECETNTQKQQSSPPKIYSFSTMMKQIVFGSGHHQLFIYRMIVQHSSI
jgi:hypothetical protein